MLYCNVHVYSCKLLQFTDKVYSMSTGSSCLRTQARELIFVICADVAGTGCGNAWKSWCSITAATVAASAAIAAIVATHLDPGPSPSGSLGALWCHGLAQTRAPCGQVTCLVCMLPTRLSDLSLCLHLVCLLCSRARSMVPLDLTYNTS